MKILPYGTEKLNSKTCFNSYDTIMSINGIEDTWDGYQYLINLYNALKKGRVLIFHERIFSISTQKSFNSIRLSKTVYDHFLSKFKQIYKFEGQTIAQIKNLNDDIGVYFIGTKL